MKSDCIHIRDLALRCIIGILPEERRERQDVIINITLECDTRPAACTDDIRDAVDYKKIKRAVLKMVEASEFHLIETLAERIAEICLAHPKVAAVRVSVDKPGALRFARSVAVEIERSNEIRDRNPRRSAAGRRRVRPRRIL